MTRFVWAAAIAGFALLHHATASAQEIPRRQHGVTFEADVPLVSFSARDLVNSDALRRKLTSGLPQNFFVRVQAHSAATNRPIAQFSRSCRIVYDLWAEQYRVEVRENREASSGGTVRRETLLTADAVLARCLDVARVRVGVAANYASLTPEGVYFVTAAEMNPTSEQTLREMRRWLSQPQGDQSSGQAVFGSFVSLLVDREVGRADRRLVFRSQTIGVP